MKKKLIILLILIVCICSLGFLNSKTLTITYQEHTPPDYITTKIENHNQKTKIENPLLKASVVETKRNTYTATYTLGNDCINTLSNELPNFGEDITFSYEWFENDDFVYYGLYTPSTAVDSKQDFPMIVWLHGGNEFFCTKEYFQNSGILRVLNRYKLNNFNSYVLCPQMVGPYYDYGLWCKDNSAEQLKRLVDYIVENYNIDEDRIYLMGFSQGGRGLFHVANYMNEYFAACVAMSPFDPSVDPAVIKVPMRAYTEFDNYTTRYLIQLLGTENVIRLNCVHGEVPYISLNRDKDKNNCADMLEWLLSQSK